MYRELKYLWSLIIPLILALVLGLRGWFSFGGIILAFVAIPVLDYILKDSSNNLSEEDEKLLSKKTVFDFLLYSNVPIVYAVLCWYFYVLQNYHLQPFEYVGINISVGIFLGTLGINVAHELGHRSNSFEKFLAMLLLLPNLYTHFTIEHNRGHHVNIATREDPASARLNEWLFTFWVRSAVMSYLSAWKLEMKRLKSENKSFFSFNNEMLLTQILQIAYLTLIYFIGGLFLLISAVFIAVVGFLMLETVNYIEHYGLYRRKTETGRYERVQPWHSWNSNHIAGRLVLYELSRHSDHHYKASRKYQILRHFDESPQLPYGDPTSMLLAFIPPLWFYIMNPLVKEVEQKVANLPVQ